MFRVILVLVSIMVSVNSYANNYEQEARTVLKNMNINPDSISGEELSQIINQFNKNLGTQGSNKKLDFNEKKLLEQSYKYLKSQKVTDPAMQKARDQALRAIERSGKL
jgi:hypothetical protein